MTFFGGNFCTKVFHSAFFIFGKKQLFGKSEEKNERWGRKKADINETRRETQLIKSLADGQEF